MVRWLAWEQCTHTTDSVAENLLRERSLEDIGPFVLPLFYTLEGEKTILLLINRNSY
jgi:hypothetical protein